MELAFSPDLPAWFCYTVVVGTGLFVAWRKVNDLPGFAGLDSPPIWCFWRAWQLVGLYTLIPVLLYWILDRTESIHDTSLFAALLVAVSYERVMSGQDKTLAVGEQVKGIWNPFQNFVGLITERIKKQVRQDEEHFNRRVLDLVVNDPTRMNAMESLAKQLTTDMAQLTAQIKKVEAQGHGSDHQRDRIARIWYAEIHGSPEYDDETWQRLLLDKEIIDRATYRSRPRNRSKLMAIVAWCALGILAAAFWMAFDRPSQWSSYDIWRISKSHTTAADVHRTRESLGAHINNDALSGPTFSALSALLRDPILSVERADVVLSLLVENRCTAERLKIPLAHLLIDSLKTRNVDIRNRVNQALLFLAPEDEAAAQLGGWNPSAGDSVMDLEKRRTQWRQVWRNRDSAIWCETAERLHRT